MRNLLFVLLLVLVVTLASCLPPPDSFDPEPFCGDGVVDLGEECDDGELNGVVCSPPAGGTCSYCSNDCRIITLTGPSPPPPEDTMPVNSTVSGVYPYGMIPGDIRYLDSTMHSISIEWDIEGDLNHNAESRVRFRKVGVEQWNEFMPLLRMNFTYLEELTHYGRPAEDQFNMFAGSLMFLTPGTEYEVWLEIVDPDGGKATRIFRTSTKPYPERNQQCSTTVGPSELESASINAKPGDVICLESGFYGAFRLRSGRGGSSEGYIAYVNAPGANPRFSHVYVQDDYLWLEGLTFDTPPSDGSAGGGAIGGTNGAPQYTVVVNNTIIGYSYSIWLGGTTRYWYIADNVIVGDKLTFTGTSQDYSGEGIEFNRGSSGHTVAFNTISHVADGNSYGSRNIDVFGNDIFRTTDDSLEPDFGYGNKRYWGNRLRDSYNYALSFQPMYSGPWYFIRNEIRQTEWTRQGRAATSQGGTMFKFHGIVDRFVFLHNTFVNEAFSPIASNRMRHMLSSYSRNNLYVVPGSPVWRASPWSAAPSMPPPSFYQNDWRTDVDYDGFIWNGTNPFVWDGTNYDSISAFSNAVGIQQNAVRMYHSDFVNYPTDLRLRQGTSGVNAGDRIIGVNDNYLGNAPDIGAYEYGKEMPHYGAGTRETLRDRHKYWEYW